MTSYARVHLATTTQKTKLKIRYLLPWRNVVGISHVAR
jgi:hypothetical protein